MKRQQLQGQPGAASQRHTHKNHLPQSDSNPAPFEKKRVFLVLKTTRKVFRFTWSGYDWDSATNPKKTNPQTSPTGSQTEHPTSEQSRFPKNADRARRPRGHLRYANFFTRSSAISGRREVGDNVLQQIRMGGGANGTSAKSGSAMKGRGAAGNQIANATHRRRNEVQ